MNISDSSFIMGSGVGGSIRSTQQTTEKASDRAQETKINTSANGDISQAAEGQQFRGEITGITGDRVNIMLENNKQLMARMNDAVNMNIGDRLTFQVKENTGNMILISPVMEGLGDMKNNAIFSILEANGFAPTEKNYNIAESLLNNNMSVDKGSMQKLMQQSYKFPDMPLDSIIQLNKMNIPVNETTIGQYNDYMNNVHQLANDVSNLAGSVSDLQGELINEVMNMSGSIDEMFNASNALLQIFSDALDLPEGMVSGDQTIINEEAVLNSEAAIAEGEEAFVSAEKEVADGNAVNPDTVGMQNKESAARMGLEAIEGNRAEKAIQETALQSMDDTAKDGAAKTVESRLGLTKEGLESFVDKLKSLGMDETVVRDMTNNSETPLKLLNTITKELQNQTNIPADKIREFFDSKEYKQILERGVKDKFTLDPQKMKNPTEVDALYKSMYEKANKLMDAFSGSSGGAGQQARQQAQNMAERIDFINNLNNMFTYAQIPVSMDSRELNSELFVYMNKKRMKDNKDEISALLHLDMDHLGPTDVHVSLHGGTVHTRFYVEDEVSARIIDEHMNMLDKAISESGFSHTNEVITREPSIIPQPNAVVNSMLGQEMEKSVKRYTFDMRM